MIQIGKKESRNRCKAIVLSQLTLNKKKEKAESTKLTFSFIDVGPPGLEPGTP
jgi:hypothetical protein